MPHLDSGLPGKRIAHFPNWKARASYFPDPDDSFVEFIERLNAGYAESVSGYFQGISEIGLPTTNVQAITAWLSQQYSLPQFTKSSPQADFNAVGDDYGLLILAQTGRSWLFTDTPATPIGWKVQFRNQHNRLIEIDAPFPISQQ